jgi:hypothetical protein
MLARIVKWRERGPRAAESAVSRAPVPHRLAAAKHDPGKRSLAHAKHGIARVQPTAARARSAGPSKTRLRKAERGGKPANSRAAALRGGAAGG